MEFIKNILDSLRNDNTGFSFRKILSILTMVLVAYLHFSYVDKVNILTALEYDLIFILVLLGLINIDKLIEAWSNKGK
jgi:hypothetical protein